MSLNNYPVLRLRRIHQYLDDVQNETKHQATSALWLIIYLIIDPTKSFVDFLDLYRSLILLLRL